MDDILGPGSNVLVTGATGFIGGEVVRRLETFTRGSIWCLVRARGDEGPAERLAARYRRSGRGCRPRPNVRAIGGDVTLPHWGLPAEELARITRDVDVIIHSAADTSFVADSNTERTNVEGVRGLIDLARRCPRHPLVVYLSTATNAGSVTPHACLREEDGCRPDNQHFNGYTHSKAVAEALLRESGLPVLTLRPSIVLSAGLPDPDFAKQILWCVPLMRCFRALPLDPDSRLDLVDVGFVADAAVALLRRPRRFDCYHISAGPSGAVTIGQLRVVFHAFYCRRQLLRLVPPAEWTPAVHRKAVRTPLQRRLFRSLRYYLPFLNMDVVFDDARLRADLGEAPAVRPVCDYFADLLGLIRPKAALREAALP
jgi:thioester reductase-like protein